MFNFKKKITVVVHNGDFHTDEVFAVGVIFLLTGGEKNIKIIRTRDEKIINRADIVADVGGIYDPKIKRFDHHQKGGAGVRENGVPYASFGLVWKEYGEKICGGKDVADIIESRLVEPVDAHDNGVSSFSLVLGEVRPYLIESFISTWRPTWNESLDSIDKIFLKLVLFARDLLEREIKVAKDSLKARKDIEIAYEKSVNKKIIVLDKKYSWEAWEYVFENHKEVLFVVYPNHADNTWCAKTVRKSPTSFENRISFPLDWAGLTGNDLAKVSGVFDAVFCHNKLFLVVAKSKEGAVKLAEKTLELN